MIQRRLADPFDFVLAIGHQTGVSRPESTDFDEPDKTSWSAPTLAASRCVLAGCADLRLSPTTCPVSTFRSALSGKDAFEQTFRFSARHGAGACRVHPFVYQPPKDWRGLVNGGRVSAGRARTGACSPGDSEDCSSPFRRPHD